MTPIMPPMYPYPGYPVVMSSDWCGDHKLDERKR